MTAALPPLPPVLQRALADTSVLHWRSWAALQPGPALIVLGSVHGNEVCGAHAIARAMAALDAGHIRLLRGRLTLVPVANPLAFAQGSRSGQRNLNRHFQPRPDPQDNEDRLVHQLAPLLAGHDALLDLHSFHTPGQPFAMVGPLNNSGPREPFARADEEMALARALGAPHLVQGWLQVYDRAARARGQTPGTEGMGTNEYMRSQGGYAVTIECGLHHDPAAIDVAWQAIAGALTHLGLAHMAEAPTPYGGPAARLRDVVLRESGGDTLARHWLSFDTVQAGQLIGTRANGQPLRAERDGCLLFPFPEAAVGQEWFYLADLDRA